MNILIFSWRDPKHPLAGGAEQVMHEHMKGWVSCGNKVTLFSSRFKNSSKNENIDGIDITRGGYQYFGVQLSAVVFYLKNKKEFDFVIDQFHGLPFFTPIFVKKPILAVIQETARQVWFLNPLPWPINWLVGIMGYFLEPLFFLLYKNTSFMTGSDSAKEDVIKMGIPSKNMTIVPHGVIISKPKPFPKKEDIFTITYLGILSKDKGIEDALRCFSFLNTKGDFRFWVIGRPETKEYGEEIRRKVDAHNLKDKVSFFGFVSQEKKFELLARTHILINPSVHEGWGLVNIEANAMGTPVIGYSVSGNKDSIRDGVSGVLCIENTPENLAQNVAKILSD